MSVSISRFVNVMTGGRIAKDWWEKPLHKKDTKLARMLDGMKADLDYAKDIGITVKPEMSKIYDSFMRQFLSGGNGMSPAKWLEAEDRLTKQATQAAAAVNKLVTAAEAEAAKKKMVDAIGEKAFEKRLKDADNQIKKFGARVEGLNPAEMVAIRTYTMPNDFQDMNKMFRGEPITGDPAKVAAKIKVLERAMSKLPKYTATQPTQRLDRGPPSWPNWPEVYEGYQVGSEMTVRAFWSTGKTGTINSSASQKILWTVYGGSGRDIDALSELKGEGGGEVLYPPNTKFKVESREYEEENILGTKTWRLTVREIVS